MAAVTSDAPQTARRTGSGQLAPLPEAFLLRSDVLLKLNRSEQALDDLSTVILIDPTHVGALLTRAHLYQARLQGRLAKDDFGVRACSDPSKPAISFHETAQL